MNSQLKALQLQNEIKNSKLKGLHVVIEDDDTPLIPISSGHLKNSIKPSTTPIAVANP